jgi:hypothetical protein
VKKLLGVKKMAKRILQCNIDFRAFDSAQRAVAESIGNALLLSEVSRVTGVDALSVQNWVKRGYIGKTDGKKYSRQQTARIILLNNLRQALELSGAARLIGKAEKLGLKADELLAVTASVLIRAKRFNSIDREALRSVVNGELRDYGRADSRLASVVLTVSLSALCAEYKAQAKSEAEAL